MRSPLINGVLAALSLAALAPIAQAQTPQDIEKTPHRVGFSIQDFVTGYNNFVTAQNFYYAQGGAAAGSAPVTYLVADDVQFISGFGGQSVIRFYFALYNANANAVAARPRIRFYQDNNGIPGAYITGYTFTFGTAGPIPVNGSYWYTDITAGQLVIPSNGKIWAAMTFDNNSNATGFASVAELNNLGELLFDPPTIGSSTDTMFRTTAPSTGLVNNPAGSVFNFGHATTPANPISNVAWRFDVSGWTVSGTVSLEGNPPTSGVPLTLDFQVGGVSQFTRTVTLDASGNYSVAVPAGLYDIKFKSPSWLQKKVTAVDLTLANQPGVNVSLKAGDANNDNAVDIGDLLVLIGAYNQVSPGSAYSSAADFNGDGANDINDLLLLIGNYNQLGD